MKEKNLKMIDDKMFIVNEKAKTITCRRKYKKDYIYGVARCSEEDTFNVEIGKAIAYAKCELIIKKKELESISDFIIELTDIAYNYYTDYRRKAERTLNDLYTERKVFERYYSNQNKIVNHLKKNAIQYSSFTNYHSILKDSLLTILENSK